MIRGRQDLNLPQEVYDQWREAIRLRKDGKPRVDGGTGVLLPVRAFYMDIQSWALEEPQRWARWAAPCPIPPADLRGFGARRRRINERTADRVRQRQPLLPALVAHVEEHCSGRRVLFEAVRQAGPVEADELAGFAVATGRCAAVVPPQPAGR
ncbi:hypothetical protein ABT142_11490 [Streptomyces sp. NPDC001857]|uniref:hypothetical protein n=1 Tax=unclassified Streptomyces TaxID=2593676 RepID=UPI00331C28C4